jgi:hypothetical protein
MGGGSAVVAMMASHTRSVRDGLWKKAASWYVEEAEALAVNT